MTTTTAYIATTDAETEEAHWDRITDPPFVVSHGADSFVEVPGSRGARAYVNGFRVYGGLHVLQPGDFVRVSGPGSEKTAFRFGGALGANVEPGRGRRCAFTRARIEEGMVVCCPVCRAVVSEKVAEQIGSCVCGTSLKQDQRSELPAEVLL